MFALHALWAPLVITALLGLHLALMGRQQHTQQGARRIDGERYVVGEPLWPCHAMTSTVLALGVAALLPYADLDLHGPYRIGEAPMRLSPTGSLSGWRGCFGSPHLSGWRQHLAQTVEP